MTFYNEDKRPWKDLTDEEKGALLLAWYEGKELQCAPGGGSWVHMTSGALPVSSIYRVKPEPKRETVTLYGSAIPDRRPPVDTHRITFDLIDGEPDCDSIRMEEL